MQAHGSDQQDVVRMYRLFYANAEEFREPHA
jgi:hypothetical protein